MLDRILILISITLIGIVIFQIYKRWFESPLEKEKDDYEKNKFKDIDGC